jgi:N-acetylneuraminate synthase
MTIRWVSDIGSNHNQNLNRALDLVSASKDIGCWGVKFQLFKAETLYRNPDPVVLEELKLSELPLEFIPLISKYCQLQEIAFGCTPFYLEAIDILEPYVDFFKIGSYEVLCLDMIEKIAKTRKRIIISTGMATISEIERIVNLIIELRSGCEGVTLLHCCSEYPASPKDCNLVDMVSLNKTFSPLYIGWSDHSAQPGVIHRAAGMGAQMIEFHLDLNDECGMESIHGHCWNPSKIRKVIEDVKIGEQAVISQSENLEKDLIKKGMMRMKRMDPSDHSRPIKVI